jgi:hypothetical protein
MQGLARAALTSGCPTASDSFSSLRLGVILRVNSPGWCSVCIVAEKQRLHSGSGAWRCRRDGRRRRDANRRALALALGVLSDLDGHHDWRVTRLQAIPTAYGTVAFHAPLHRRTLCSQSRPGARGQAVGQNEAEPLISQRLGSFLGASRASGVR